MLSEKPESRAAARLGFWLLALAVLMAVTASCREERGGPQNFILMTLDTQRADFLGSYASEARTPNLNSLALSGIVYENCYCLVPTTLPSHANMFFSEEPHSLQVFNNGQVIEADDRRPSFVRVFKNRGYTTAAFLSLGVLKERHGLGEGFDLYQDEFPQGRFFMTAEEVNRNLLPWIEGHQDEPFFLWVHYSDPHEPYHPPDTPKEMRVFLNDAQIAEVSLDKTKTVLTLDLNAGANLLRFEVPRPYVRDRRKKVALIDKFQPEKIEQEQNVRLDFRTGWHKQGNQKFYGLSRTASLDVYNPTGPRLIDFTFRGKIIVPLQYKQARYRSEVEYMDKHIGNLLQSLRELGLFDKTHFLVVGDHGEGLGEFPRWDGRPHYGHTHYLNSVYMRVPLIVRPAGGAAEAHRIDDVVTTLDVAPTVLSMMGFGELGHFQGENLFDLPPGTNRKIFQQAHRPLAHKDKFALLHYPWHLIFTPVDKAYELYDLGQDPYEVQNLFEEPLAEPVRSLKAELDSFTRKVLSEKVAPEFDKESERMLKALGYIK
jgi:arylsulfatase A-like enzyme